MKRVEYLLIALMSLCAVIFIGACAKKSSESMVQTPNSPATTYLTTNVPALIKSSTDTNAF